LHARFLQGALEIIEGDTRLLLLKARCQFGHYGLDIRQDHVQVTTA